MSFLHPETKNFTIGDDSFFVKFFYKFAPSPTVKFFAPHLFKNASFLKMDGGVRWLCGAFFLKIGGGMFRETVLTACGTGRFAVTIKERRKARTAQTSSSGIMPCEPRAVFPNVTHTMPRTLRVSCGIMRRQVSRGRIAMPHLRC